MVRVSGVPYEVTLPNREESEYMQGMLLGMSLERLECVRIAQIPGMTPEDIVRAILSRGNT